MSVADAELLRLPLPCNRQAPCGARSAVRELDALDAVREDAVLLASELVSSAVIEHGVERSDETIELVASHVPDGLRIAVATGGASEDRPGRLLARVVEALSRQCGFERSEGQASYWAVLAL